jgi:hypothetical protein
MVSVREVLIGLKKKSLGIEVNLTQQDFSIRTEFNAWFVLEVEKVPRKRPCNNTGGQS